MIHINSMNGDNQLWKTLFYVHYPTLYDATVIDITNKRMKHAERAAAATLMLATTATMDNDNDNYDNYTNNGNGAMVSHRVISWKTMFTGQYRRIRPILEPHAASFLDVTLWPCRPSIISIHPSIHRARTRVFLDIYVHGE